MYDFLHISFRKIGTRKQFMEEKMNIDIEHACCFTGHRPERLENITEQEVKKWLRTKIEEAVNDGIRTSLAECKEESIYGRQKKY